MHTSLPPTIKVDALKTPVTYDECHLFGPPRYECLHCGERCYLVLKNVFTHKADCPFQHDSTFTSSAIVCVIGKLTENFIGDGVDWKSITQQVKQSLASS